MEVSGTGPTLHHTGAPQVLEQNNTEAIPVECVTSQTSGLCVSGVVWRSVCLKVHVLVCMWGGCVCVCACEEGMCVCLWGGCVYVYVCVCVCVCDALSSLV